MFWVSGLLKIIKILILYKEKASISHQGFEPVFKCIFSVCPYPCEIVRKSQICNVLGSGLLKIIKILILYKEKASISHQGFEPVFKCIFSVCPYPCEIVRKSQICNVLGSGLLKIIKILILYKEEASISHNSFEPILSTL